LNLNYFIKFVEKYADIFDQNNLSKIEEAAQIKVYFSSVTRYANFSVNLFYIESTKPDELTKPKHEVRLYSYWCFDCETNLPNETATFYRMIKVLNENNPKIISNCNKKMPKLDAISNYMIHSE
jgi:hypothetical protein